MWEITSKEPGKNTREFNREKLYLQSDLASLQGSSKYSEPKIKGKPAST